MNFYQTDTLSAVVARLRELIHENHTYENTLVQLCNAGETAYDEIVIVVNCLYLFMHSVSKPG